MDKMDPFTGSLSEVHAPLDATEIIHAQVANAAEFIIHPHYRHIYTPLHLFREVCRIAHMHEIDFRYRTILSGKSDVLSVSDRLALPSDASRAADAMDAGAWRDADTSIYNDVGMYDAAWSFEFQNWANRPSLEHGTLPILAQQITDAPNVYGDILALIYEYFSRNENEDIMLSPHTLSRIMVLGCQHESILQSRSQAASNVALEIMKRGVFPTIVLSGARYLANGSNTTYSGEGEKKSEAIRMKEAIMSYFEQHYRSLSENGSLTHSDNHLFASLFEQSDRMEMLFQIEDSSTDTEKNFLASVKKGYINPQEGYILVTSQSHIPRAQMTELQLLGRRGRVYGCDWVSYDEFSQNPDLVFNALLELVKMIGELNKAERRMGHPSYKREVKWDDSTDQ